MTTVDLNPFFLTDPPAGAEDFFRNTILPAITFDWERMRPFFNTLPGGRLPVRWETLDGGAAARYIDYAPAILIDPAWWDTGLLSEYRVIHEMGHLVDLRWLNNRKRASLMVLLNASPTEFWKGHYETPYYERIHEAWADTFVMAYAPTVAYHGNYTHQTTDRAGVVAIMDRSDQHMPSEQWAGANRYETAQIVSMNRYPQMPTPVIAYIAADGTPDAQSAAAAAGAFGGTFLLHPSGATTAHTNTLAEITRLKPTKIVYIGGTMVIPQTARNAYDAAGQ